MSELNLKPCPWCKREPVYFIDKAGVEIWCRYKFCRANPHISLLKGYTKEQVTVVWNSYTEVENKEIDKKPVKDLTKFKEYICKKELCSILIDVNPSLELWENYLPEYQYMTCQKKEEYSHAIQRSG